MKFIKDEEYESIFLEQDKGTFHLSYLSVKGTVLLTCKIFQNLLF